MVVVAVAVVVVIVVVIVVEVAVVVAEIGVGERIVEGRGIVGSLRCDAVMRNFLRGIRRS